MTRLLLTAVFTLILLTPVHAQRLAPRGAYGAIELAAATPTKMPTTGLLGRTGVTIQNLGAAEIWCGVGADPLDPVLTATNGVRIAAGTSAIFFLSYKNNTEGPWVWCLSVAGQTAPADTRWLETR